MSAPHRCDGRHILFRVSCSIMTACYLRAIVRALLKPPSRSLINLHWVLTRTLTLIKSKVFHRFQLKQSIINLIQKMEYFAFYSFSR
jgi:hypothetical protein